MQRRHIIAATVLAASLGGLAPDLLAQPVKPAATAAAVQLDLSKALRSETLRLGNAPVDMVALRTFYQARQGKPLWSAEAAPVLLTILAAAEDEGLDARAFEMPRLPERLKTVDAAEAELLMTAAALRYISHMHGGRVDFDALSDDWKLRPAAVDPVAVLTQLGAKGAPDLAAVAPAHPEYAALKLALTKLREQAKAGGWPKVTGGPTLKPGMDDPRVAEVRARLVATGELAAEHAAGTLMDEPLVAAIMAFQARHGLEPDGGVGKQTVLTMNVQPQERMEQVALNMERWRWMPRKPEANRIVVNVAAAWLEVYKDGKPVMAMRTVVGDREHHTPAFRGAISSGVLNPTWTVPTSIATKEVLPKLQKDPSYLIKERLRLVGFEEGDPMRDGVGPNWKGYSNFPYTLRQDPGDDNALGRVKFNIPNPDDIYLHDTPSKKAFTKTDRALSHGCVRVEMPIQLAEHLLGDQKSWGPDKIAATIAGGQTQHVPMTRAVPVYIGYWTAFADEKGSLQLRPDVYGRDPTLRQAMRRKPGPQVAEVTVKRN